MKRWSQVLICVVAAASLVSVGLGATGVRHAFADGTTLFVAPTGTDTANSCVDSSAPCRTLGYALSIPTIDHTIQLEPGTYAASDNPVGTANRVSVNQITIQSERPCPF